MLREEQLKEEEKEIRLKRIYQQARQILEATLKAKGKVSVENYEGALVLGGGEEEVWLTNQIRRLYVSLHPHQKLEDEVIDEENEIVIEDFVWTKKCWSECELNELYSMGYDEGYERGYSDRENEEDGVGYDEGYDDGYDEGYERGYSVRESEEELENDKNEK